MIINVERLIEYLSKWIGDYAKDHGKELFILVNSDNRRDIFTNYICSQATKLHGGLKLNTITTNNPEEITLRYNEAYTLASKNNGIIVGSIDRTFGLYFRNYPKIEYSLMDICPLFDLEYTDIIQATNQIWPNRTDWNGEESTDVYMMLEFCNYMEKICKIITDENPPHKHSRWPFLLRQQKDWIAKTHQREKWTRHKEMTKPFPKIPNYICTGPAR
jgi:hypothetical protein